MKEGRQLAFDTDVVSAGMALLIFVYGVVWAGVDLWRLLSGHISVIPRELLQLRMSAVGILNVIVALGPIWALWIVTYAAWNLWAELDRLQKLLAVCLIWEIVTGAVLRRVDVDRGVRYSISMLMNAAGVVIAALIIVVVVRWFRPKVRYV